MSTGRTDRAGGAGAAAGADAAGGAVGGSGPGAGSAPQAGPQSVRLDVWLWSARLMPTRSAATAACRGGHVRRNGDPVKAAQRIVVGDELRVRSPGRERIVVVTRILTKRVGAPIAREAYEDHSPEPVQQLAAAPPRRERGTGRPTKRERRQFDRLRGRDQSSEALDER